MCISAFVPSSSPSYSFIILLIQSLGSYIPIQNCLVVGMFSCHLRLVGRYFLSLFWNVLLCLYRFTLYRYLFDLPSLVSTFWFISSSCIVIFPCVAFSFLSLHVPVSSLFFFIIWPLFSSNFPSWFFSCFLRRYKISPN